VAANQVLVHSKKEKFYGHTIMDCYHRSGSSMASGLFRSERKFKVPEDRQLDPHSDRNCHHTHHIAPPWSVIKLSLFNDKTRSVEADGVSILLNCKAIYHPDYQLGGRSLELTNFQRILT
jgi:hypothetical protein